MTDVTLILSAIEKGDASAAEQLLPLVYDELRRLAHRSFSQEPAGQTLQPTALVHEAYLRLVNTEKLQGWNSRGHFFAAAAQAMRRILVENARRKKSPKRGGNLSCKDVEDAEITGPEMSEDVLALNEALTKLARSDPTAVKLVELRYFSGLTISQASEVLGMSSRSADRLWAFARVWLLREIQGDSR